MLQDICRYYRIEREAVSDQLGPVRAVQVGPDDCLAEGTALLRPAV